MYAKLLKVHPEPWFRDAQCPQSKVGGFIARPRVQLDEDGSVLGRARIIDHEDGRYEIQTEAFSQLPEQDPPGAEAGDTRDGDSQEQDEENKIVFGGGQGSASPEDPPKEADQEAAALRPRRGARPKDVAK